MVHKNSLNLKLSLNNQSILIDQELIELAIALAKKQGMKVVFETAMI
ncbi:MAG: hypothetical protein ACRC6M_19080 [Microcystaceae cyanobacterium]